MRATRFSSPSRAERLRQRARLIAATNACGSAMMPTSASFIAISAWIWLVPS